VQSRSRRLHKLHLSAALSAPRNPHDSAHCGRESDTSHEVDTSGAITAFRCALFEVTGMRGEGGKECPEFVGIRAGTIPRGGRVGQVASAHAHLRHPGLDPGSGFFLILDGRRCSLQGHFAPSREVFRATQADIGRRFHAETQRKKVEAQRGSVAIVTPDLIRGPASFLRGWVPAFAGMTRKVWRV